MATRLTPDDSTSSRRTKPKQQLGHTPLLAKRTSVEPLQQSIDATAEELLKKKRELLDKEMLWTRLPLRLWMVQCVPGVDAPSTLKFPSFVVDTATQRRMYPGLEEGFNGILETIGCAELFTTISIDSKADTSAPESPGDEDYNPLKPDMVIVPKTHAARDAYEFKPKGKKAASADATDVFGPVTAPASATGHANSLPSSASSGQVAVANPQSLPPPPAATSASGKTSDAEKEMTRTLRMAWAFAEIVMEIKNSDDSSPFCWDEDGELSMAQERVQSRGELAECAMEVFRRQHRLSLFAIAIAGATAVLVRFDRNGAVVSEAFNYFTSSTELGNLFYRLFRKRQSDLSIPRELRGHDPTAEPACESCTALFRGLHRTRLPEFDPVAIAGLEKAAKKGWPIYCLSIKSPWSPDGIAVRPDDPVETHRVLVGRPLFSSLSMMGRGTRGFVGWDLDADRPVFVKDSWRTESPSRHSELEIYHRLWDGEESQSVSKTHIPTVLGGGDVSVVSKYGESVQRTRTQDLVDDVEPNLPRVHSRIVMKEIGRRLTDFEHVYELGSGVYGALQGMESLSSEFHINAPGRGRFLHRDISVNNILIMGSRGDTVGLLCDWDLAKTEQQLEDSNPTRAGTWQYMSALRQRFVEKRHELSDDLESFLHILTWSSVRYFMPTCLNDATISSILLRNFDVTDTEGYEKYKAMLLGEDIAMEVTLTGHPFAMMRVELMKLVKEHYESLGVTLNSTTRLTNQNIVKRKPRLPGQPDAAASPPVISATAQTVGAPRPSSVSTTAVTIDLTGDPATRVRTRATIPKTPKTSPLYTHAQFLAIMNRWLHFKPGWPQLVKRFKPLQGTPATSTPAGSRASSSRRPSEDHDPNTRPSKRAKVLSRSD
ncbi:hypothetical protein C8T65DRAFT_766104 [Cerioporus squamosus]|nr:hypothetical protein C8T65DRAFT_766104 [Cerioporus squamosus]